MAEAFAALVASMFALMRLFVIITFSGGPNGAALLFCTIERKNMKTNWNFDLPEQELEVVKFAREQRKKRARQKKIKRSPMMVMPKKRG